jgi:hypothetical protein
MGFYDRRAYYRVYTLHIDYSRKLVGVRKTGENSVELPYEDRVFGDSIDVGNAFFLNSKECLVVLAERIQRTDLVRMSFDVFSRSKFSSKLISLLALLPDEYRREDYRNVGDF